MEMEQVQELQKKSRNLDVAVNRAVEDIQTREGTEMKLSSSCFRSMMFVVMLAALLGFAPRSRAQYGGSNAGAPPKAAPPVAQEKDQSQQPPADPEEDKAYKAIFDLKGDASDQTIQLGEQFLQKYPLSRYTESVDARLVNAYYQKQQYDKMYAAADKALALKGDDVAVLVLVGWVIPHNFDPNDPEAERRLAKAAAYEKHALELIPTMPKPANITDEQFIKAKAASTAQAHSGLGLIYFRQQNYADSVDEMQKATQADPTPDPVDLYIMGVGLSQLKRYPDAVDAFQKCSALPGPMQDRCKQKGADTKKLAAAAPAPPK